MERLYRVFVFPAGPVEGQFVNSLMQTLRSGKIDLVSFFGENIVILSLFQAVCAVCVPVCTDELALLLDSGLSPQITL